MALRQECRKERPLIRLAGNVAEASSNVCQIRARVDIVVRQKLLLGEVEINAI
jgi:hypothetical protein